MVNREEKLREFFDELFKNLFVIREQHTADTGCASFHAPTDPEYFNRFASSNSLNGDIEENTKSHDVFGDIFTQIKFSKDSTKDKNHPLFEEALAIRNKKAIDYNSSIKLVDYFPDGIDDVLYMMHVKLTRLKSLAENAKNGVDIQNESFSDTLVDLVNYASFAHDLVNGVLDGQTNNDVFNPKQ